MRRSTSCPFSAVFFAPLFFAAMFAAVIAVAVPASAQKAAPEGVTPLPPHAWLFGSWVGGFFPPPAVIPAALCMASPVVIFTRDVVLRSVVTDLTYAQREIETVRAAQGGVELRFISRPSIAGPLGLSPQPQEIGFGCENPSVLHVVRRGENEIAFPRCADFPYPLVRCSSR